MFIRSAQHTRRASLHLGLLTLFFISSACTSAEPPLKPRPSDDEDMAQGTDQDSVDMDGCPIVPSGALTIKPVKTVTQAPDGVYRCASPDESTNVYNLCDYGGASAQASACDDEQACQEDCSPYNRGESLPSQGQFCPDDGLPPGQIAGRFNDTDKQWRFTGRLLHRITGAAFSVTLDEDLTKATANVQADMAIIDENGCRVGVIYLPASSGEVTPLVNADGALLGVEVTVTVMHQDTPETIEATIPVIP